MRLPVPPLVAALIVAVAAWCSAGVLALAGAEPGASRIGSLPPAWQFGALLVAAAAVAALWRPAPSRVAPLFALALILLPWAPLPLPDATLIWAGPAAAALWLAAAVGAAGAGPAGQWRPPEFLTGGRTAPVVAFAVAFALFMGAAWRVAPEIPGGDEPHYLVIAQSLLRDRDLRIEDNHARREYLDYVNGPLKPDFLRRGRDGAIYSIHAPGLAVLLAPAYALGGYPAVVIFLALIAAAASALLWHVCRLAGGTAGAAWIGWAAGTLTAPFVFHSFTVYPDMAAAALVLTGIAAAFTDHAGAPGARRWLWHGAALALLPWLHTRYAALAGAAALVCLGRLAGRPRALRNAGVFLLVPAISAAGWAAYFYVLYGTVNPAAPYGGYTQSAVAFIRTGLPGLLFDQQFGIVPNAPVYLAAFWALARMTAARDRGARRLAMEVMIIAVPYLLLASAYRMWWGGHSAPARFAVPVLPLLALPLAWWWGRPAPRMARVVTMVALGASLCISAALACVDRGGLLYNARDGSALWLQWASALVDLPGAMPSFIRDSRGPATLHAAVWLAALAAAALLARVVERTCGVRLQPDRQTRAGHADAAGSRGLSAAVGLAALALGVMIAATAVWALRGTAGRAPARSQAQLLRTLDRRLLVSLDPARVLSRDTVISHVRFSGTPAAPDTRAAAPPPMLAVRDLPAGVYQVHIVSRSAVSGNVAAYVGRARLRPLFHASVDRSAPGADVLAVRLPVDVSLLSIVADESVRASGGRVALRPVIVNPTPGRVAVAATEYAGVNTYVMNRQVELEPNGCWIPPRMKAEFAVQVPSGRVSLVVRNGPVPNEVEVASGAWREPFSLTPGEERVLTLPHPPGGPGSAVPFSVTSTRGFRPADVDPSNGDTRMLGVWIEISPQRPSLSP